MKEFRKEIYNQHNVVCNQKYSDNLPYSAHLSFVEIQGEKFIHLIPNTKILEHINYTDGISYRTAVRLALISHDCIEDARMTFNDLSNLVDKYYYEAGELVAEIVYCVTDEKGRNRSERKNNKYYKELKENKLAVFVKLADLAANTLYSRLSGSSMYDKYKKEWPKFKEKLYLSEYKEFFNYIENI